MALLETFIIEFAKRAGGKAIDAAEKWLSRQRSVDRSQTVSGAGEVVYYTGFDVPTSWRQGVPTFSVSLSFATDDPVFLEYVDLDEPALLIVIDHDAPSGPELAVIPCSLDNHYDLELAAGTYSIGVSVFDHYLEDVSGDAVVIAWEEMDVYVDCDDDLVLPIRMDPEFVEWLGEILEAEDRLFEDLRHLIANMLGAPPGSINRGTRLRRLGATEDDILAIMTAVERDLGTDLAWDTSADIHRVRDIIALAHEAVATSTPT